MKRSIVVRFLVVLFCVVSLSGAGLASAASPVQKPISKPVAVKKAAVVKAKPKVAKKPVVAKKAPVVPAKKPTVFRFEAGIASFNVNEVLRGSPFAAIGTTSDVSTGDITVDWASPEKTHLGEVKIDARTFKTESSNRDNMIRKFILKSESAGNEYIVFAPKSITGLAKNAASGKKMPISITGDLAIAGVTHSATFKGDVIFPTLASLNGSATTTVKRADYGINIPSVPFVASVEELVTLTINLSAKAK